MAAVAVETALTLANKIVGLVSTQLEKKRKIDGQEAQQLQELSKNLQDKLRGSADIEKLIRMLEKAEIASSNVGQLKDLIRWVNQSQPNWGEESEVRGHVIYELVKYLIDAIQGKQISAQVRSDLSTELSFLPDPYKKDYKILQQQASLHAVAAIGAQNWEQLTSEINQVDGPLDDMINDIQENINKMTQSLFATTPGPSPKLPNE